MRSQSCGAYRANVPGTFSGSGSEGTSGSSICSCKNIKGDTWHRPQRPGGRHRPSHHGFVQRLSGNRV